MSVKLTRAGIGPFLVHPDRAVAAVVDDEDDRPGARLHRRAKLLAGHLEVAVTGEGDDGALRVGDLGGDGGGHAVAHGAGLRRQETLARAEGEVLVRPGGEVAGAVGQDGIVGEPLAAGCAPPRPCRAHPAAAAWRGWRASRRARLPSAPPSARRPRGGVRPAPASAGRDGHGPAGRRCGSRFSSASEAWAWISVAAMRGMSNRL